MASKFAKEGAMSSAVSIAQNAAAALVQREERRQRSRMLAYDTVARNVGRSTTWLRELLSGGLRRVDGDIKRRLDALLIRELEAEVARLTHELEVARRSGDHPASAAFTQIEDHLARAQALLNGSAVP